MSDPRICPHCESERTIRQRIYTESTPDDIVEDVRRCSDCSCKFRIYYRVAAVEIDYPGETEDNNE